MPAKIAKNNLAFRLVVYVLALAFIAMMPQASYAYDFENRYGIYDVTNPINTINTSNYRVCAINHAIVDVPPNYQNLKQFGFVKRTVICVKEAVLYAAYKVLVPFSNFFANIIAVMCTLAVIVWGMQAMAGKRTVSTRDAFVLAVKIGIVIMFTSNFAATYFDPSGNDGGLFGLLLDSMEQFLAIVIGYADVSPSFALSCYATQSPPGTNSPLYLLNVWDKMDCMIETLIGGIFSPLTLSAGIAGFFIAALLSGVLGFFIGVLGLLMIAMLLVAIARTVYIFISAFLAFALMVIISPMVIPTILFPYTKPYFDKWLKVTLGFILQPVFMFVYLAMLLAVFDVLVIDGPRSLYRSITGPSYDRHVSPNRYGTADYRTIGQWALSPPAPAGRPSYGVYQPLSKNEFGVNLNYNNTVQSCDETQTQCERAQTITKNDVGMLGTIGEEMRDRVTGYQSSLYDLLGSRYIFKTSIPVTGINWDYLLLSANVYLTNDEWDTLIKAYEPYDYCRRNPGFKGNRNGVDLDCDADSDPNDYQKNYFFPYVIGILLSAAMAVVTIFIFMMMLRTLPYIGTGISGEALSIPRLGIDKLAMPGSNSFENLQKRLGNSFLGRQG